MTLLGPGVKKVSATCLFFLFLRWQVALYSVALAQNTTMGSLERYITGAPVEWSTVRTGSSGVDVIVF